MEIADIFVINKSDRDGAEHVEKEIRTLQSLAMRHDRLDAPPIVKTVASEGRGIEELAVAVASYEAYLQENDLALNKSVENWRQERLVEMLRDADAGEGASADAPGRWRSGPVCGGSRGA